MKATTLTIRIEQNLKKQAQRCAERLGLSLTSYLCLCIRNPPIIRFEARTLDTGPRRKRDEE